MSTIDLSVPQPSSEFGLVALDLYRDIHKGIRAELFSVVLAAATLDPDDDLGRADLAGQVRDVVAVLESHAEHEDVVIGPALAAHLPDLAADVQADHRTLDGRTAALVELASATAAAPAAERRRLGHLLHLDLAAFTGAYLEHQDLEERVVMPALEQALGLDVVVAMHQQIVGSIPPDEMARSLAFMIPAMNIEDRVELLGGMQAGAPPEVFAGVWGLVGGVLAPADVAQLASRLGVS